MPNSGLRLGGMTGWVGYSRGTWYKEKCQEGMKNDQEGKTKKKLYQTL